MRNKFNLFSACLITIVSLLLGYLNLFTNKPKSVNSLLHGNYLDKVFNILLHNIIIVIFTLASSLLLIYIGPIILTFITFYVFGSSVSTITAKQSLVHIFLKYPHFIPETIAIILVLYISLNISRLVLKKLLGEDIPLLQGISKELMQMKLPLILFIISAMIEGLV